MINNDMFTRMTFQIFRLNGLLVQWGDRAAAPFGLSTAKWQILGAVAAAESPPNVPQIAERIGISRQGALKQINILVADGWVAAQPNPAHKRSPLYTLTEQGTQVFEQLQQIWLEHVRQWLPAFAPYALTQTVAALEQASALIAADIESASAQ